MREDAWNHVVGRVNALLISPAEVDVGDVAQFVASALGLLKAKNLDDRRRLAAWDAPRVRKHFDTVVGDPRGHRRRGATCLRDEKQPRATRSALVVPLRGTSHRTVLVMW